MGELLLLQTNVIKQMLTTDKYQHQETTESSYIINYSDPNLLERVQLIDEMENTGTFTILLNTVMTILF